jgi:DMSO/TMAO reductase YedYZ molybdopterin-dependent catalytic subunit
MASQPASHHLWTGRLIGAVAMLAMLAVVTIGREWFGTISLLDTLADGILLLLPLSVFSWLLDLLGTQAKTALLLGLAVLLLLLGAWLGGRLAVPSPLAANIWQRATTHAAVLFLLLSMLIYLIERQGGTTNGLWRFYAVLGVASLVFGVLLAALIPAVEPVVKDDGRVEWGTDRRTILGWGAAALASAVGLVAIGRDAQRVATRETNIDGTAAGQMPPAITPNDDFYVISKNFVDPTNDRGPDWSIEIDGLVHTPMTLFRADLTALGEETFVSTMLCISNPVGGDLIGTAEWTGVPLWKVFDLVGVQREAYKAIFEAVDGYTTGVPVERVTGDNAYLVWMMNGEPLPDGHGGPVRTIIPALYGMKTAKWLTKITLTEDDWLGYWETRNWTDEAIVKTISRIDVPGRNDVFPAGPVRVGGVAFAGDRGVSRVELSTDGGETWNDAQITQEPNPEGIAWVLWEYDWQAGIGEHQLVVRAIEGDGTIQTEDETGALPDGASGWHRIRVGVA